MKLWKKLSILLVCIAIVCAVSVAYAQPVFNASISLNTPIKKADETYLSFNEAFDVTLNLKTGKNYFAGPFSAQIFYTNSILKNTTADFNKSGQLYSKAKSFSNATASYSMTEKSRNKFYPTGWTTTQKSKYDFCNVSMIPNTTDATNSVDNINENIVTLHFTSGTNTGSGTVFISADSIKSSTNTTGETYLSCLTDSGNILSSRYDYGTNAALDLANAALSFTVSDLGDVDNNKKINSSDALLMLQHITSLKTLSADAQKKGDINGDNSMNATDALIVLQLSTGLQRLNSIIKR